MDLSEKYSCRFGLLKIFCVMLIFHSLMFMGKFRLSVYKITPNEGAQV